MGTYRPIIVTAECGTLTRAAKLLGYTQPSLSYVISSIESDLGIKLFHRDQRGMRLTKAGTGVIDLMRQMEDMDQRLREIVYAQQKSLLRVGIFTGVSSQWMPGILSAFFRQFPETEVKLVQQRYYLEGEMGVKDRTLDCAFFLGQCPPGLESIPLHEDPYYLVVGEGCELYSRESVSLDELRERYAFIPTTESFDPGSAIWTQVFQDFSKGNLVDFEPLENQTCIAMVEEGLGVTILPELSLYDLLPGRRVRAIPLTDPITRTIHLLCPPKEERSVVMSAFLQLVQRRVQRWKRTGLIPPRQAGTITFNRNEDRL